MPCISCYCKSESAPGSIEGLTVLQTEASNKWNNNHGGDKGIEDTVGVLLYFLNINLLWKGYSLALSLLCIWSHNQSHTKKHSDTKKVCLDKKKKKEKKEE